MDCRSAGVSAFVLFGVRANRDGQKNDHDKAAFQALH
jgi:hypothetical protein